MSTIRYVQSNTQFLPNILQHVYVDVGIDFENVDTAVSMAEDMSEEDALSELDREEGYQIAIGIIPSLIGDSQHHEIGESVFRSEKTLLRTLLAARIGSFDAGSNEMIMDVRN
ncbi:hypothetical protein CDAR_15551 [Caerostris darwini]|uniref:Uncharacterized protein n=1 Tax=Caerostris darwini TaxID=1538125 RepID=A0AAV4UMR9_9ARAC|nr:hypothetical protein CDAR_15551 [Caerostris darwini]